MAEEEYAVMMEMCKLGETAKVLVSCGVENILKHASARPCRDTRMASVSRWSHTS